MVVGPPARTNSKRYRLQVEVLPASFVETPRLFLRARSRLVHPLYGRQPGSDVPDTQRYSRLISKRPRQPEIPVHRRYRSCSMALLRAGSCIHRDQLCDSTSGSGAIFTEAF